MAKKKKKKKFPVSKKQWKWCFWQEKEGNFPEGYCVKEIEDNNVEWDDLPETTSGYKYSNEVTAETIGGTSLIDNLPEHQFLTLFTDEQQKYKMEIHYYKGNIYNVAISYDYEKYQNIEEENIIFFIRDNKTGELVDKNKISVLQRSNYDIQELIKQIVEQVILLDKGEFKELQPIEIDNENYYPILHEVHGIQENQICKRKYDEDFLEDVFNYILENLEMWGQIEPNDYNKIETALEFSLEAFFKNNLVEAGYHLGELKKYIRDRWNQEYAQEIEDIIYTILQNNPNEFYDMIKKERV